MTAGSWRPTASLVGARRRARILAQVRSFFAARGVLEVQTPVLASAPPSDPHLAALATRYQGPAADGGRTLYLQTSPEFAMKRLLAAGWGSIYSLGPAFRDGEAGRRHNPEFTMLEWYRPGFDHLQLMDEVDALLQEVLGTSSAARTTYRDAFEAVLGVDPHHATTEELAACAANSGMETGGMSSAGRDDWLGLLFAHLVEPGLGRGTPTFVLDYPASQAALARVRPGPPPVAERFEVYVEGVELANGYHELTDADEQRRRFVADLADRRRLGLPEVPLDHRLLAALEAGMPDSAGVALGFDRLVMLALGAESLAEVVAFPLDRV